MSSRLNVKQSKKDRPKSSDKLRKNRQATPEKSATPSQSQEGLDDLNTLGKNVLMNDEIAALAIKTEDLDKLKEPRPPSERKKTPKYEPVIVRKLKPASEWDRPRPKIVTVAKPAPPDATVKPIDYSGVAGPRFDAEGKILAHSILGSVEDFTKQAIENGELPAEMAGGDRNGPPKTPTLKFEKKKHIKHPVQMSVDESNALVNWQKRMRERKRQQGHISKLVQKLPDQLVMNQADNYRKTQELRYLIDRTIPCVDYGKGYRVGSEFWKQQELIGGEDSGIHMTLGQTDRGYPPPFTHIGVPNMILEEKGTFFAQPRTPIHHAWDRAQYLEQRKKQLLPIMKELDPHKPDILNLEVVGSSRPVEREAVDGSEDSGNSDIMSDTGMTENEEQKQELAFMDFDPLSDHPDVHPEPIFGPSIQFAGQPARWTGDSHSYRDQVGIEARVTFDAFAGERTTSFLEITNDGTTAMYYDWKRVPKTNPFDVINAKVQRFYFNTSNGVILPGDTMKFPFVFKSPNAGVFTEQWEFETKPVVCGGAALVVTLRGVALQEDKFQRERSELEHELSTKQAETVVKQVLENLVEGIRTPERSQSPIDAYITEEEIFSRKNTALHYSNETVHQLKELYLDQFPEEEREGQEWDLSVADLKQMIMDLDEDDERKEEFLQRMNKAIMCLSFPPLSPLQERMYSVGYQTMMDAVDKFIGQTMLIRQALGMPDSEEIVPEGDTDLNEMQDLHRGSFLMAADCDTSSTRNTMSRERSELKTSESKRSQKSSDKKDKKGGGAGGKDSGKGPPKTPGGKDAGKGKNSAAPKKPPSRSGPTPGPPKDSERPGTPGSGVVSPTPGAADPILDKKYKEKVYVQAYNIFGDMFDHMDEVFRDIHQESDLRL